MAQVARTSQVLPAVKCSSCGQPVPLARLGDHVCPPPPLQTKSVPVELARASPPTAPSRRTASIAVPNALHRVRTPSNAGRLSPARPALPPRLTGSPSPPSPVRRDPPPPPAPMPLRSALASHAPSSATPPLVPPRTPSERPRTSSTLSIARPPLDRPRPSLDTLRRRPSPDPQLHPAQQIPPASHTPPPPFARPPRTALLAPAPAPAPGTVPFPSSAPMLPQHLSVRQPPPPPLSLAARPTDREFDTKIGGEAGMAGVGRRGFAAAARAAMLAATLSNDGRRGNVPQHRDTSAALGLVMRAAMTPPLSPNSAQTPSPVSPFPVSPVTLTNGQLRLPSPHDTAFQHPPVLACIDKVAPLPFSPGVRIASSSRSPSPIPNPFERRVSGETISQSPMPGANLPLPFLDVLKPQLDPGSESDDESVYTTHSDLKKDENSPSSPSAESDVGLAYAQDSDDDTPIVVPLDVRKSAVNGAVNKVKFPAHSSPGQRHASRQASAASLRSAVSSRSGTSCTAPSRSRSASAATQSTAKSIGALERAMETLIEEGAYVSVLASGSVLASIGGSTSNRGSGKPSRSNTVPGPASPEQKPPKLPTRSHTSPSHPHVHSERVGLTGEVVLIRNKGSAKRKDRTCAGCDSKIEDGRWIKMDGGSVLCERCWKNMYLPKCRRCSLPIEKQAVSSRDGQLKGKYHKECFNCHTCQRRFPDKEFYVFDGKPFCAYHYHEANNSLCGAHSCGQPIEGPCAVTHSGKRYHPEHLLCEFDDGCKERLEEYWEVDGQMLCERHAAAIGGWTRGNDSAVGTQARKAPGADEGRMMKRMTRFIDLGGGGDDELDIR